MTYLLHNLLHFGRLLHSLGLDVHAGRMQDVARALDHVDIGRRPDFYFTLRSLLIHRQQDLATFEEAFRVFWRRPPGEWSSSDLRALGEQRRFGTPQVDMPFGDSVAPDDPSLMTLPEPLERVAAMSYGSHEVSRVKDFALFTDEELRRGEAMIAELEWDLGTRTTRRWEPREGKAPDLRRVVRRNIRYGGEPLSLPTRNRVLKPRPLVLICDVSGSMERYARMLLHFIHSLMGRGRITRAEAFLFATRLTRITREMSRLGGAKHGVEDTEARSGLGWRHADWRSAAHVQCPLGEACTRSRAGRAADFRWVGSRRT